jgi:hypothetical protein
MAKPGDEGTPTRTVLTLAFPAFPTFTAGSSSTRFFVEVVIEELFQLLNYGFFILTVNFELDFGTGGNRKHHYIQNALGIGLRAFIDNGNITLGLPRDIHNQARSRACTPSLLVTVNVFTIIVFLRRSPH